MKEHQPTPSSSEKRSKRGWVVAGIIAGTAAVGAVLTGAYIQGQNESRKAPEMIITGDFLDDGEVVSIASAVNMRCNIPMSGDPRVRVESRTVTNRDRSLGRVIVSNFEPDVSTCDQALQTVHSNPDDIYLRLKDNVTGYNPDITGDGNINLAEAYQDVIEAARADGVTEYAFHG